MMKSLLFFLAVLNSNFGTAFHHLYDRFRNGKTPYLLMATIADKLATSESLSIFTSKLKEKNCLGLLTCPGPYTVFAPTDASLIYANTTNDGQYIDLTANVLSYHLVPGLAGKNTLLTLDKKMIMTVNGAEVYACIESGTDSISVNGIAITGEEIWCDNGVIHIIDSLMIPRPSTNSDKQFDPKDQAGVCPPLGYFDPLHLCPNSIIGFSRLREAELKHGRIAMLATLGVIVAESGLTFLEDSSPAIYQYQRAAERLNALSYNLLGFAASVEGVNIFQSWVRPRETELDEEERVKSELVSGDLRFDPLGLKPTDFAQFKEYQTKELNNGRLAMVAMFLIVFQELTTDSAVF